MFKKEEYQSPAIEVVGIESESQIMAGSVNSIQYGGDADNDYFDDGEEGGSGGSGSVDIWAE